MQVDGMATRAYEDSPWRTWKPYAAGAVAVVGAAFWYFNFSSFATLKDGDYSCMGVYVNEAKKYELLTDEGGNSYRGTAEVQNGQVVGLSGVEDVTSTQLKSAIVRSRGTSHFHVTEDPGLHSYYAIACDFSGA